MAETQRVIITLDMASTRHAEQGCDERHYLGLEIKQNGQRMVDWVQADSGYRMSRNIEIDLQPGTYKVGVFWLNSDGKQPQDYNVHIYSSASPIHLMRNGTPVSSVQEVEYLGPEVAAP